MIKKILSITNILLPIIFFAVLQFNTMSPSFVNIMTMTLLIGWALPFFFPIITGICLLKSSHHKLSITINILNFILTILIILLISIIYDSHLLLVLIFYSILSLLNIINVIFIFKDYRIKTTQEREFIKEEKINIKKLKKENNGIIR